MLRGSKKRSCRESGRSASVGCLFSAEYREKAVFAVIVKVQCVQPGHVLRRDGEGQRRVIADMGAGRGLRQGDEPVLQHVFDAQLCGGNAGFFGDRGDGGILYRLAVGDGGVGSVTIPCAAQNAISTLGIWPMCAST